MYFATHRVVDVMYELLMLCTCATHRVVDVMYELLMLCACATH